MTTPLQPPSNDPYVNAAGAQAAAGTSGNAHVPFSSDFIIQFAHDMAAVVEEYMTGKLNSVRVSRSEIDQLNKISAALAQFAGRDSVSGDDYKQLNNADPAHLGVIQQAIANLPEGSSVKAQLQQMLADNNGVLNRNGQGGRDDVLGKDDISSLNSTISSMEKDAEQRAQDDGLVVSQKMGDHDKIFAECSEMMRSLADTQKNIISKWG